MRALRVINVMAGVAAGLLHLSCESPVTSTAATTPAGKPSSAPSATKPAMVPAAAPAPIAKVTAPAATQTPAKPEPKPVAAAVPPIPEGTISQMDLGTLFELQGAGRAFVVDVRPAFFYNLDHIPGAISLPLKSYDALFGEKKPAFDAAVAAGKVIVLYCTDEDCPDGGSTARKLAKDGYSSSIYTGGWKEWKDSGLGG